MTKNKDSIEEFRNLAKEYIKGANSGNSRITSKIGIRLYNLTLDIINSGKGDDLARNMDGNDTVMRLLVANNLSRNPLYRSKALTVLREIESTQTGAIGATAVTALMVAHANIPFINPEIKNNIS